MVFFLLGYISTKNVDCRETDNHRNAVKSISERTKKFPIKWSDQIKEPTGSSLNATLKLTRM